MRRVIVDDPLPFAELQRLAQDRFGDMVKAVVDVENKVMLVDADLHADEEAALLAEGSVQRNLWGINLYPDLPEPEWIEFDSLINLRPSFGNRSRGVDDVPTQEAIRFLVDALVKR